MGAYENFARVYDELMDQVPYGEWADRITEILAEYGIADGLILDLCCGTGRLTRELAGRGYDMIGVDISQDMLQIARESPDEGILYLMQDARSFELYGTVRAVVCACDSLNYITGEEDLLTVFRLVNNYLDPGGLFIFDMTTAFRYRNQIGNTTIAEDREDVSFIWYNEFEEETQKNYIDLTLFVRDGNVYRKFEEAHEQKAYEQDKVLALLKNSGLRPLGVFDGYDRKRPGPECGRILYVAGEQEKERKKESK